MGHKSLPSELPSGRLYIRNPIYITQTSNKTMPSTFPIHLQLVVYMYARMSCSPKEFSQNWFVTVLKNYGKVKPFDKNSPIFYHMWIFILFVEKVCCENAWIIQNFCNKINLPFNSIFKQTFQAYTFILID